MLLDFIKSMTNSRQRIFFPLETAYQWEETWPYFPSSVSKHINGKIPYTVSFL